MEGDGEIIKIAICKIMVKKEDPIVLVRGVSSMLSIMNI
jgi:hypothetical protein